jgi:predicted dehydrogenase
MNNEVPNVLTRRQFITAGTAASAWLAMSKTGLAQAAAAVPPSEQVNVAVVGCGDQGRVLINACLKIPQVKFRAVCDVWPYAQRYASRYLGKFGHETKVYADYREMLEKEKGLDAIICASPDWVHAPISCAALEAGKHVYCEKLMSNTIEGAKQMVLTQRKTKKLLQIGHQRRSNPRYLHAKFKLIDEAKILGRITHASGQWHRAKQDARTCAKTYEMDEATLKKFGYDNMQQFMNWRWYKKFGGGPICDLGAHQIDMFNWFFNVEPKAVIASGGIDYYKTYEWYDNVICVFEYETKDGMSRAMYDVLTTTSSLGFLEKYMGIEGSLVISEIPRWNQAFREKATAPEWTKWGEKGILKLKEEPPAAAAATEKKDENQDVRVSPPPETWEIPVSLDKPPHQPHLENFFEAIKKGTPLNCPAEVAYRSAVAVLKVNEAVAAQKRLELKPEDYKI